MTRRRFKMADLYCGAGGTSTGATLALEERGIPVDLVACNHWHRAVETHAKNHPRAIHACEDVTTMDPKKVVPGGKLDLLVASPECTHHSVARGGKPVNDQSRASSWCILRWATSLQIDRILIENVKEYQFWGPIGSNGKPLKSRRGETFNAFIEGLKSLGYKVEYRVLNCADHGDPTTRERLFVQAVRGRRPIRWPDPMYARRGESGQSLFSNRQPWKSARDHVIDWSIRGKSIFDRKRPLSENTLKRIEAGLRKFGGKAAEPFLVLLRGTNRSMRSVDEPIPTLTASGGHVGLCEPFVMSCTHQGGDRVYSTDNPLPTVTTARRGEMAMIEPFILPPEGIHRGNAPRSLDQPLQTVTAGRGGGVLVEPFVVNAANQGGDRVYDIDDPLPTVTTIKRHALVEPFMVPYYGACNDADSIHDPIRTVTTRDRLGLVEPTGPRYDLLFRMLQPHELAAAMSFPKDYQFSGNREDVVKQIGNAVPVQVAKALCGAIIEANFAGAAA